MTDRIKDETELIQTYLAPLAAAAPGAFGLRDDAALLSLPEGSELVVTSDPIRAGTHFFATDNASDIAWKALAVNVSDLAAKGATPLAYILALAFPEAPEKAWMGDFTRGLAAAQAAFGCVLVGGDTDRAAGPLSIGVTAFGAVAKGRFVRRQGAAPGDHLFVTGTIGDSALGLDILRASVRLEDRLTEAARQFLVARYLRPTPRLALAPLLSRYASAALDVSDGFVRDLQRLCGTSGLRLSFAALPMSSAARAAAETDARVIDRVLSGGDDYEILLAIPPHNVADFVAAAAAAGVEVTDIGILKAEEPIVILGADGQPIRLQKPGYDHFSS